MTMEKQPFEDASPIRKKGDFPLLLVFGGVSYENRWQEVQFKFMFRKKEGVTFCFRASHVWIHIFF